LDGIQCCHKPTKPVNTWGPEQRPYWPGQGWAPAPQDMIPKAMAHRLHLAWIDAVVKGGIYAFNVYLKDSDGLSQTHMTLLEAAAACLNTVAGPWVAAGDWNMSPELLASSGWLKMVDGVVFATQLPTCHQSTYDYFVVHRSIAHAVVAVQRLEDGGLFPHYPTRLLVRGNARRYMVRELVKPRLVAGELPAGPPNRPPSYFATVGAIETDLNLAAMMWYETAREELADLAGHPLTHRQAHFKWAPAVPRKASRAFGGSKVSMMWRILEQKARSINRIILRGVWQSPEAGTLPAQVGTLFTAHHKLTMTQRKSEEGAVLKWANAFWNATRSGAASTAKGLTQLAGAKAKKIEAAIRRDRLARWKCCIGATAHDNTWQPRPSKLAYSWVRGLAGWQH
jgi:hypothetical protein